MMLVGGLSELLGPRCTADYTTPFANVGREPEPRCEIVLALQEWYLLGATHCAIGTSRSFWNIRPCRWVMVFGLGATRAKTRILAVGDDIPLDS